MANSTVTDTPNPGQTSTDAAKGHFAKAIEEAKAGAQALGKDAQDRADLYRDKLTEKGGDWVNEAKARSGEAKDRATDLANQGKAGASRAISSLGKLVEDNAPLIDEKVGIKYGEYARTAARSLQDTADKLETKELNELGDDAKEFIRQSPGLAVGIAAVGGFILARLLTGSKN
jgi:ElaB/YqjD/DUF883 family membrane-anchored ribosome-binding protein